MHQAKSGTSMTTDYYEMNALEYFEKTVSVDPSSFLLPPVGWLKAGASVLDVGCGSGRDLLWLKSQGFAATGFERSPALAEMARKHTGCTVIEGDFARHDFSAFSADAVILIGALVHLSHDLFAGVLRNIAAALKAGGLILLTVKEGADQAQGADGRIFYLYQDSDLRRTFASLGMDVIDSSRNISRLGTGEVWLSYLLEK